MLEAENVFLVRINHLASSVAHLYYRIFPLETSAAGVFNTDRYPPAPVDLFHAFQARARPGQFQFVLQRLVGCGETRKEAEVQWRW